MNELLKIFLFPDSILKKQQQTKQKNSQTTTTTKPPKTTQNTTPAREFLQSSRMFWEINKASKHLPLSVQWKQLE